MLCYTPNKTWKPLSWLFRYIEGLVQEQVNSGIPSERIVVGGFRCVLCVCVCAYNVCVCLCAWRVVNNDMCKYVCVRWVGVYAFTCQNSAKHNRHISQLLVCAILSIMTELPVHKFLMQFFRCRCHTSCASMLTHQPGIQSSSLCQINCLCFTFPVQHLWVQVDMPWLLVMVQWSIAVECQVNLTSTSRGASLYCCRMHCTLHLYHKLIVHASLN